MAGVSVEGAAGGRRRTDSEINMIPMIDLLICTISFLLITAVWSHMSRIEATAQVPGSEAGPAPAPDASLHVTMRDEAAFQLVWKHGATVIATFDVPRHATEIVEKGRSVVRYVELARAIDSTWRARGAHRDPADHRRDLAVLHTGDRAPFAEVIAVLDAIRGPQRDGAGGALRPAFDVSLATD